MLHCIIAAWGLGAESNGHSIEKGGKSGPFKVDQSVKILSLASCQGVVSGVYGGRISGSPKPVDLLAYNRLTVLLPIRFFMACGEVLLSP